MTLNSEIKKTKLEDAVPQGWEELSSSRKV